MGSGAGKIDLVRLESGTTLNSSRDPVVSNGIVGQVPIRSSSRGCNALSFSPVNPNLLAVGLDKVRNESNLIVWDISNMGLSNGQKSGQLNMVQQYSGLESVTSLTFLPESSNLVLAGVMGTSLRLFDLRNANSHTAQVQCKVQGITLDPFNTFRFASYGEGAVNVWDARKLTIQLVGFSMKDALADGARYYPNDIFSVAEFSSSRRGVLATLVKDANHVRFWDIQSTPPIPDVFADHSDRIHESSKESSGSRTRKFSRLSWTAPSTILPWNAHSEQPASPSVSDRSSQMGGVVLSNTYRSK